MVNIVLWMRTTSSTFECSVAAPDQALINGAVYPNPCCPVEGQVLTISGIPLSESNIYIYDIAGNLVRILSETEMSVEGESKKAIWNLKNSKGKLVGRGTYVYYIPGAAQNTGKITVIK